METTSLSVRLDSGNVKHNNRRFIAKNVDPEKVKDNITYVSKDLEQMYKELFSAALQKYNDKQKRADRKIPDYYEHIKNSKQEKPFYEAVIQFGNISNAKVGTIGGDRAKKMLDDYMKDFEKRNPNFKVFNAVMHLDEATPHLHIDFVPIAHSENRGLELRTSLKAACKEMGILSQGHICSEWQQWAAREKDVMKSIAKKYGLMIDDKNIKRPHLTVDEYKEAQREIKAVQEKVKGLYAKSDTEIEKSDIELLINQNKMLQQELSAKDTQIHFLEEKTHSKYLHIRVSDEQKISFLTDRLRSKGIDVVDDVDGFHVPEWVLPELKEIEKSYKPTKMSWRKELALTIDRLIYSVSSLNELLDLLKDKGYEVHKGKYISIKPQGVDRAVRTKTLGEDYTEDSLIRRIANKGKFLQSTDKKITETAGIEQTYYIAIKQTAVLIMNGTKEPKKYHPEKCYSMNNDFHINQLANEIAIINREHISNYLDLQDRIEKLSSELSEVQHSVSEITKMQTDLRDVLQKGKFYFENKGKRLDALNYSKFSVAKEVMEKYKIDSPELLTVLERKYQDNVSEIAKKNKKIVGLQSRQSELLKVGENYQSVLNGSYIDKYVPIAKQGKR